VLKFPTVRHRSKKVGGHCRPNRAG